MALCKFCGTEMSFYQKNEYGDTWCNHIFSVDDKILDAITKQKERESVYCHSLNEIITELKSLVDSLKNKHIYR